MKKFWMLILLNPNPSFNATPTKRHHKYEEAKKEAERLCEKDRKDFGILELTEYVKYPKISFKWKKI